MILKNVIAPVLLMLLGTVCFLACLGERKEENKTVYMVFSVALFILLLFSLGGVAR